MYSIQIVVATESYTRSTSDGAAGAAEAWVRSTDDPAVERSRWGGI
jgi:hypothetical protein